MHHSSITGAQSEELHKELGITHVVTMCDYYPSTGDNHLVIPIYDAPYADVLTHLPQTCQFIENALQQGGRVLVHCFSGISRSPTVIAAYMMKTRKISHTDAISYIEMRQWKVNPNHGFITQLKVYGDCDYDPSPSHSAYNKWRVQRRLKYMATCGGGGSTAMIVVQQTLRQHVSSSSSALV
ncbi:phosphatases II [Tricholoma matsutake]|nr:phosphatases II [Tricholoma matsutake 945]